MSFLLYKHSLAGGFVVTEKIYKTEILCWGMKTTAFFFAIIAILIIIVLFAFSGGENGLMGLNKVFGGNEEAHESSQDSNGDVSVGTNPTEGSVVGAGDSAGVGGSGGGTSSECDRRQISYSLTGFQQSSECNNYSSGVCINKVATCLVDVKNLDYDTTGTFEVNFRYFDLTNESDMLQTDSVSFILEPRKKKAFESVVNIQGNDAGKEISCSFLTGKTPYKEVC